MVTLSPRSTVLLPSMFSKKPVTSVLVAAVKYLNLSSRSLTVSSPIFNSLTETMILLVPSIWDLNV